MQFREYGAENPETIILLHGGGLSWWNYREEAEILQARYHVVLPILDGHAGSGRPFTSIEDCAGELIAFIDERFGGSVPLIGGLSLGAQILVEMLSQRPDLCRFALVESAMVIPQRLTGALIGPAFGASYGLIRSRAFSRLQFRSLHIQPALFEDYYRDTCLIRKPDMIAFMKANTAYALRDPISRCAAGIRVFAGEKETRGILRSAELLRARAPRCAVTILPGFRHGEFSLNHADRYCKEVQAILGK